MKKTVLFTAILIFILFSFSCTTQTQETEEPAKIENTLQSVSYFKDTVGYDSQRLLEALTKTNEAIDSIGYPDAGYKLWIIQADTADIRFMVEGFWPDQEAYDIIHNHQLYQDAQVADSTTWEGLESVEYHRFVKVK